LGIFSSNFLFYNNIKSHFLNNKAYVPKRFEKKPNMTNARMVFLPRATAPASIDWRNNDGKNYVQAIED
jgi:hypothetical protein